MNSNNHNKKPVISQMTGFLSLLYLLLYDCIEYQRNTLKMPIRLDGIQVLFRRLW